MKNFFAGVRRSIAVLFGALLGVLGLYLMLAWGEVTAPLGLFPVIVDPENLGGVAHAVIATALLLGGLLLAVAGLYVAREPPVFTLDAHGRTPATTVNRAAVRELVRVKAAGVEGVSACEVGRLRLSHHRWRVRCDVVVKPGSVLPEVSREVQRQVARSLEETTGVPVEGVEVRSAAWTAAN